ncbi:MAG: hypothetical protein PHD05_03070 [Sphaerochaetaceae bacterium]|nr:hypothetical protein [Sphaerochaetaceae bacterium]
MQKIYFILVTFLICLVCTPFGFSSDYSDSSQFVLRVCVFDENCTNGIDDDCDGSIDKLDSNCYIPPSNGSSGTTTHPNVPKDVPSMSTIVISNTTETLDVLPDELKPVLKEMKDEQGNSLYSENEIIKIIHDLPNYDIVRNVLVEKIVYLSGSTNYRINVKTIVKNKTSNDLVDIKVVIEVPKKITDNASNIKSLIPFTILVNDPIIEFNLPSLKAGQDANIVYTVVGADAFDVNEIVFTEPIIRSATKVIVPPINPPVDPIVNPPVTPEGISDIIQKITYTSSVNYILIIVLVLILIVVLTTYFEEEKKKKNK